MPLLFNSLPLNNLSIVCLLLLSSLNKFRCHIFRQKMQKGSESPFVYSCFLRNTTSDHFKLFLYHFYSFWCIYSMENAKVWHMYLYRPISAFTSVINLEAITMNGLFTTLLAAVHKPFNIRMPLNITSAQMKLLR